MQPITISSKNPTRSVQYIACIEEINKIHYLHSIGTICTGACLDQEKYDSAMLHEIVPQDPLQRPLCLAESLQR
jgi:hypothetical protein